MRVGTRNVDGSCVEYCDTIVYRVGGPMVAGGTGSGQFDIAALTEGVRPRDGNGRKFIDYNGDATFTHTRC